MLKLKMAYKIILVLILCFSACVFALDDIQFFNSKFRGVEAFKAPVTEIIKSKFALNDYRTIRAQVIYNNKSQPDHILVFLFSKRYHSVEVARINIGRQFHTTSIMRNYQLSNEDWGQQPTFKAHCPNEAVEFIAFAPNEIAIEQDITKRVARAAEAHKFKTIRLLKNRATRANYLNYMKCPKLKGNFYNGDANTELITTVDGVLSYKEINANLHNQFRYKVTNIWLACRAFNDPIKSSVIDTAQAQKYAAGVNDLIVGPSDKAAACAMKAAMNGKPMTAAFQACCLIHDDAADQWGFSGNGLDFFGT